MKQGLVESYFGGKNGIRAPIITERLRIRAFSMEDAQDLYEYLADPQIYQYEHGEPINLDQAYTLAHDMSISEHF